MTTRDHITGTELVTRYRYHDGYFDGREREFRGFGLVEQIDAAAAPGPDDADGAPPPVFTRTWFDVGAHVDGPELIRAAAAEAWAGDPDAWHVEGPLLPSGLDAAALREASRARRTRPLRQEIFAEDGTAAAGNPYTVAERRTEVRLVQPADRGHPAVFLALDQEALEHHYERNPADPRVSHRVSLDVDAFGTVLRAASVTYPRRAPEIPEQAESAVIVTERDVVHDTEDPARLHVALPIEARSWELAGLAVPGGRPFTAAEIADAFSAAETIPPEDEPTGLASQRRVIDRVRHLYYADDLSGPLPAGQTGSRALPYRTERLAFTQGLLDEVFGDLLDARGP